jgi:hypothetical protein
MIYKNGLIVNNKVTTVIGVLILLMVLPAITYQGNDISYESGLKKLFWFGRSNCKIQNSHFCQSGGWISHEGW